MVARGALAVPQATGWPGVRESFALRRDEHNFAAWYFASHPAPVRAAIERNRRGLDADARTYMAGHEELEDAARRAAAAYLQTSADQIALTDSTPADPLVTSASRRPIPNFCAGTDS